MELKPVLVPDFMDTTDILLRDGRNQVKASQTGRWGERLSVGVTRALAQDLTRRLPGAVIAQADSGEQPSRTLLINISEFDIWPDGRCELVANWKILGNDGRRLATGERDRIVTPIAGARDHLADKAIVEAMSNAVQQLADHIATGYSRTASVRPTGAIPLKR